MGHQLRLAVLCLLGSTMACLPGADDRNSDRAQVSSGAMVVTDPGAGLDCLGNNQPSHPELFVSFFSSVTTGTCPSSACVDFVMFDTTCSYTLQVKDQGHTVQLNAADCAALTRWLASDLFLSALRDSARCGNGNGRESAQVELQDGWINRKYEGCNDQPYEIHRACMAKIRAKYFPGM